MLKKLYRFTSKLKSPHTITKMNDNINIDSTFLYNSRVNE